MKNFLNFKSFLGIAVASLILASCAPSDKVVNNNLIQKRKYNKGFFIDLKKNDKETLATTKTKVEKKAVEEKSTEVKTDVVMPVVASTEEVAIINNAPTVTKEKAAKKEVVIEENIVLSKKVERVMKKVNKAIVKQSAKAEPNAPAAAARGGKSQIVALVLCGLIGALGIHRFYLGYTWQGIVQLLTAGACGIWSLIDFIRIITGDLGPASGRYDKTL